MSQNNTSPRPIPAIDYPQDLPVSELRVEIASAIENNQVVIVAGETGSGKTTQLPKICLGLGRGAQQLIGHTQPRRLAARTVAARIAQELHTELGDMVGYQVRFHDQVSDATAIKLMTDGILLAEMQRDRLLRKYDTLIIDEAHERSLNIDFLLGYLKRILPRRPDLKVIITSATIDVDSFSRHFNDAPVIEVSGRAYPIETHYVEGPDAGEDASGNQICAAVEDIAAGRYGPRGDVLVFLPGERDIRETAKALRHHEALEVLPLYARLSHAEQNRVFEGGGRRAGTRVVLATNVAETSLTVPGIRYVVDPGEARISRYSHRTKLQRLPVEAISRASADQRRGRCGRVGPGVCIRLYSEEDFNSRPEFTDPEIKRTNLAAVVLQMLTLGLGDIEDFPFLNPPDGRMVRDGYKLLEELGAVDASGKLTEIGKRLSRLPVDPRLARMTLAAPDHDALDEVLVIASALAVQDPRERPADKQTQADQMHVRFRHKRSDFMAWINLWRYYEEQRQSLSQNQLRKLCKREYLSFMRMREWRDIHMQLSIACRSLKMRPRRDWVAAAPENENYDGVHKALLAGLLSNIAQWQEGREFLGARSRKLQIFPGSALARKPPKWLVAGEIVETSRVFAREIGTIDPRWVLDINPTLLKHHYYQPRWHPKRGQVVAYERVALYGLTVTDKQVVHYGPLAPQESRTLMIREGLIPGRLQRLPEFLRQNRALVQELENLESRTRRRDILVDEHTLFEFYDERLPADIHTVSRLQSWLKRDQSAAQSVTMSKELLLARDPGDSVGDQFPNHLEYEDLRLKLTYQFEPGHATDGVSITVPVALLNRIPEYLLDWLVPGLLREKCIALVKALPKEKRKHLVPVPDSVDRALVQLQAGNVELLQSLGKQFTRTANVSITRADWDESKLEDYYRMNVKVVDAKGKLLEQGRDFVALRRAFKGSTGHDAPTAPPNSPARDKVVRWDIGDIPQQWSFRQAGLEIISYPAMVDQKESVAIVLCDYPSEAALAHRLGVLRLLRLGSAQQVKYLRKQMLRGNEFSLLLARAQLDRETLIEDLIDAAYTQSMGLHKELPYTENAFRELQAAGQGKIVNAANELESLLNSSLSILGEIRQQLLNIEAGQWLDTQQDISAQLERLLQTSFLRDTPLAWASQYPRYLKAMRQRLERLSGQYAKDQKYTAMLQSVNTPLVDLLEQRPTLLLEAPAALEYRWLLEEFRVSLFAQNLGTKQAVSEKRLRERWLSVVEWCELNPT